MSKFTIIVKEKGLDKLVENLINMLKAIPQIQVTQTDETFVVRTRQRSAEQKGKKRDPNLASRFANLFQNWKSETLLSSNGREIVEHPSYDRIIELGEQVVPFILIKLKEDPHHLFYALYKITGENPVQSNNIGDLNKMAADWIDWGIHKGYLS